MSISRAEKVKQVYDLMADQKVTIYDLELWGHIASTSEDELAVTPEEAFSLLDETNFNLVGDGHAIEHYYQATADHVTSTLREHDLLKCCSADDPQRGRDHDETCENYDGAPCCADPGCSGNPCTFPGYADNH